MTGVQTCALPIYHTTQPAPQPTQPTQPTQFVQVGQAGVTYNVPIGVNNTFKSVEGGFLIGTTEVMYHEWYDVRTWAEKNGYRFANKGREGHDGTDGAAPTSAQNEPVTKISWRDVIVWSNAKSERESLKPVYVNFITGKILKKWKDNPRLVEQHKKTENNAFKVVRNGYTPQKTMSDSSSKDKLQ